MVIYIIQVGHAVHAGMITVEAGGLIKARNLHIVTDILKVDKKGLVTLTGQGLLDGQGAGTGRAGGGYGGRGGSGNTAGTLGQSTFIFVSLAIFW